MTQVLTLKTVKRKAREAYKARRLTAQHRDPSERQCVYDAGSCRCAIGASMSKTTLKAVAERHLNRIDITGVSDLNIIGFRSASEMSRIEAIQDAHDNWAKTSRNGATSSKAQNARRAFLKLIAA